MPLPPRFRLEVSLAPTSLCECPTGTCWTWVIVHHNHVLHCLYNNNDNLFLLLLHVTLQSVEV